MTANTWVRQAHRWLSVLFTLTVVAATIAVSQKEPVVWVTYLPLFPLALLQLTGMYLFVLPYTGRWRKERGTGI